MVNVQPARDLFIRNHVHRVHTYACTYVRATRIVARWNRVNESNGGSSEKIFLPPSFLFPFLFPFFLIRTILRTKNEKGIITSNCTRKLYGSLERKRNEEEKWGEGEKPSYLPADILERRGVEWGREKRAKRKKNRAKGGWWRLTVESAANCGEKGKSWPGWVTFFRVEVADFCFHSINPPLPRG